MPPVKFAMSVAENNLNSTARETPSAGSETLPDFAKPPVTEVALSLQFEPIAKLTGPVLGLLWGKFKNEYSRVEEHPSIEPVIERFGSDAVPNVKLQFQVFDAPPPSRVWFMTDNGSELVQVQHDRFVHNWRKTEETDEYPRYSTLRKKLISELEIFNQFVMQEQLGELVFNQTEVTFVNTIISGEGWERHGQLSNVLTIHSGSYSDDFFSEPENVQIALRYVIPGEDGTPRGRLHIGVVPVVARKDKRPALNLSIIARCTPDGSVADAIACLDLAHRWIVKGFASITTKEMHSIWGRQDE